MATGSSEWIVSASIRPCRKRTHRPFFRSTAGINSIRSPPDLIAGKTALRARGHRGSGSRHIAKILQDSQAMRLTLLGMELHTKHVVVPDTRDKAYAVIGGRGHRRIAQWFNIKRMREVEIGILRDAGENRRWAGNVCLIPAHMRDFEYLALDVGETVWEPPHPPLQDIHAFVAAKFFAFSHQ